MRAECLLCSFCWVSVPSDLFLPPAWGKNDLGCPETVYLKGLPGSIETHIPFWSHKFLRGIGFSDVASNARGITGVFWVFFFFILTISIYLNVFLWDIYVLIFWITNNLRRSKLCISSERNVLREGGLV